ncbi:MAG: hypothetical protein AAF184_21280 [Pseudomonadota bacterium]
MAVFTLLVGGGPGATQPSPTDGSPEATATMDESTAAIRVRRQRGPKERYGFAERRQRPRFA